MGEQEHRERAGAVCYDSQIMDGLRRAGRGSRSLVLGILMIVPACVMDETPGPDDNPATLVDSTGASFGWDCSERGCSVQALPETPPPPPCADAGESMYGVVAHRFVAIAGACLLEEDGWSSRGQWSRPVACESSGDCPQLFGFTDPYEYECRAGLCQHVDDTRFPAERMTRRYSLLMCLGPYPREETIAVDSEAAMEVTALVHEACGSQDSGCEVPLPEECLQP